MSARRDVDLLGLIKDLQSRVDKLEQGITNGRLTLQELTLFDPRSGQKITLTVGRDALSSAGGKIYPAVGFNGSLVIYNLNSGNTPSVAAVP